MKNRRSIIQTAVIILGIMFYFYYGIYKMIFVHFDLVGRDFIVYYHAAGQFLHGKSIYTPIEGLSPYFYPPIGLIPIIPFCLLSLDYAIVAWFIFCHVLILISALIIYSFGNKLDYMDSLTAAVLVIGFSMPLQGNIISANLNILIVFGLSIIYASLISGRKLLGSSTLAICTYLKIYPCFLSIAFLKNRDFKFFKTFILCIIFIGFFSFLIFGLKNHFDFFSLLPSQSSYSQNIESISLPFVLNLFIPKTYWNIILLIDILFCLALLISWWSLTKHTDLNNNNDMNIMIDLFVLTTVILLVFPSTWVFFYHALMIVPFYFIIFGWLQDNKRFKYITLFFILFFLINFWQQIRYHIPVSLDGNTISEIYYNKGSHYFLYPLVSLIHFVIALTLYFWILTNYKGLLSFLCYVKKYSPNPNRL